MFGLSKAMSTVSLLFIPWIIGASIWVFFKEDVQFLYYGTKTRLEENLIWEVAKSADKRQMPITFMAGNFIIIKDKFCEVHTIEVVDGKPELVSKELYKYKLGEKWPAWVWKIYHGELSKTQDPYIAGLEITDSRKDLWIVVWLSEDGKRKPFKIICRRMELMEGYAGKEQGFLLSGIKDKKFKTKLFKNVSLIHYEVRRNDWLYNKGWMGSSRQ